MFSYYLHLEHNVQDRFFFFFGPMERELWKGSWEKVKKLEINFSFSNNIFLPLTLY